MNNTDRPKGLISLRSALKSWKSNKVDPQLQRTLQHGWLVPYLLDIDAVTWQRWEYWCRSMEAGKLLDEPIPEIFFEKDGVAHDSSTGYRHLDQCLNSIPKHGSWQGWESWQYMDYLLDYLLFGFGYHGQQELPKEPSGCDGAGMRLYQIFNLGVLLAFPYDYWGDILAANRFGKRLGFYPTPHCICQMMARMLMQGDDCRNQSVADCCLGTGRMLLEASNYSLCLYGMDINETVIKASLVNAYCYAPWLVKPLPFLSGRLAHGNSLLGEDGRTVSEHLAEQMKESAQAQPAAAAYLANTVYDRERQHLFAPILKLCYGPDETPLKPSQTLPEMTPAEIMARDEAIKLEPITIEPSDKQSQTKVPKAKRKRVPAK